MTGQADQKEKPDEARRGRETVRRGQDGPQGHLGFILATSATLSQTKCLLGLHLLSFLWCFHEKSHPWSLHESIWSLFLRRLGGSGARLVGTKRKYHYFFWHLKASGAHAASHPTGAVSTIKLVVSQREEKRTKTAENRQKRP